MKLIIVFTLAFSSAVFGVETQTECPMMKELNSRTNTKRNLKTTQGNLKPAHLRGTRAQ